MSNAPFAANKNARTMFARLAAITMGARFRKPRAEPVSPERPLEKSNDRVVSWEARLG
jgi:hypothetical protein